MVTANTPASSHELKIDSDRPAYRGAHRPGLPELVVFVAAVLMGGLPTLLRVVHPPSTHDEFAYLLAADTFAHGRLTNPPHLLWEHFETFHQIMQPTYQAKFPPGQGLALAAGRVLFGREIVGAWGVVALGCAAICWMLRAYLPTRWAILGGLLAASHPLLFWWGQIYWGGGVALLGGALLLGAVARWRAHPRSAWSIVGAAGIALLAMSRPFEGALLTLIIVIILIFEIVGANSDRPRFRALLLHGLIPAAAVLLPVGAWMLYYNHRVTGDALTMPYVLHARQYMTAPLLWFTPRPQPPQYRHEKLVQYYADLEHQEFARQRGWFLEHGLAGKWREILKHWLSPPTLSIALLGTIIACVTRFNPETHIRRAAQLAMGFCILFPLLHMLLTPWLRMQYLAPLAGLFFLAATIGLRQFSYRGHLHTGMAVVVIVVGVQLFWAGWTICQMVDNPNPPGAARANLVANLNRLPGQHVVIVRYGSGAQHLFEWVFNEADIDRSKVVFAREMGPSGRARLIDYFHSRRVWILSIDGNAMDLREITGRHDGAGELPQLDRPIDNPPHGQTR